jgi:DNA-binding response OmpR family regulator
MQRILIVEDNPDLAFGLRNNLEIEGYTVEVAEDGHQGLARVRASRPALIVLDLMIPGIDGYRVLRTLREEKFDMPVLILSARGEEADKIRGFRMGADDYVTKPFSLLELLARVQALLRRAESKPQDSIVYTVGDIRVDVGKRAVYLGDDLVDLTATEYDLIVALARRNGGIATRQELLKEVWGHLGPVVTRTVDTHIFELRRKLEHDPASPRHILTVRKMGYRLRP